MPLRRHILPLASVVRSQGRCLLSRLQHLLQHVFRACSERASAGISVLIRNTTLPGDEERLKVKLSSTGHHGAFDQIFANFLVRPM